ncbi:MAG: magnesium transporter [Candidatus Izemoplasma sp.]|nr:magnesium transporter [Candidatus Izemoplasma sp.]
MDNTVEMKIHELYMAETIDTETLFEYHPYDLAQAILSLEESARDNVYEQLNAEELALIFSFLEEEYILDLFTEMPPRLIVNIIQELDIDDAVDVIEMMEPGEQTGYLRLMDEEHRSTIKQLLRYEEDTAGAIMTTAYVEISVKDSVESGMKKLLKQAVEAETINTIYITDAKNTLVGTLSLREMILARKGQQIKDIMNDRIISVKTHYDQEDVASIFKDYDFTNLPVVDSLNRMLGIITIDDIVDVIEEEAQEDYGMFAGVSDIEIDSSSETVWLSTKKRLPWLIVLSVLGFVTSAIISQFEGALDQVPTIALFMPMILGMAGNTGTQALAVTVRALNNDAFSNKALIRNHLIREIGTGLLNGIIIGLVLFLVSFSFLLLINNVYAFDIAFVVSISIVISLTVSTFAGAFIPMLINAINIDPAVASGPFVTVINDILALSVYFTLATMLIINTL